MQVADGWGLVYFSYARAMQAALPRQRKQVMAAAAVWFVASAFAAYAAYAGCGTIMLWFATTALLVPVDLLRRERASAFEEAHRVLGRGER